MSLNAGATEESTQILCFCDSAFPLKVLKYNSSSYRMVVYLRISPSRAVSAARAKCCSETGVLPTHLQSAGGSL